MNRNTLAVTAFALAALASGVALAAGRDDGARTMKDMATGHGEMLRRRAGRQERLRRGRGHHLRRHVQGRLSGQCLEKVPKGTCTR